MENILIKADSNVLHKEARGSVIDELDKIQESNTKETGIDCKIQRETVNYEVLVNGDTVGQVTFESMDEYLSDDKYSDIDKVKDIKKGVIVSYTKDEENDSLVTFDVELIIAPKRKKTNLSDKIEEVKKKKVEEGIISSEDFDRNVEVLRDNFVSDELIVKVVETYEKQKRPVCRPHTIYREFNDDSLNFSLLVASALCGQANILKGEKSTGKNACAETLAMVLNLPYFCIGLNSQTCDEEMTGTKNTDNTDVEMITENLAKDYCIFNNKSEYDKLDDERKKEVLENASKYQVIKDKCASVHIIYETTPYINWLEEGGVLCVNEINMGAPNFLQKFLNSILDNTGFIEIPSYGKVEVNKNCVLIGTENENYIGTNRMNEATLSRFGSLIFENPKNISEILKAGVEDYAKEVDDTYFEMAAEFFNKMRQNAQRTGNFEAVSIRGLIAALNQYSVQKFDFRACVEQHVVNHCVDREAIYKQLDEIISE